MNGKSLIKVIVLVVLISLGLAACTKTNSDTVNDKNESTENNEETKDSQTSKETYEQKAAENTEQADSKEEEKEVVEEERKLPEGVVFEPKTIIEGYDDYNMEIYPEVIPANKGIENLKERGFLNEIVYKDFLYDGVDEKGEPKVAEDKAGMPVIVEKTMPLGSEDGMPEFITYYESKRSGKWKVIVTNGIACAEPLDYNEKIDPNTYDIKIYVSEANVCLTSGAPKNFRVATWLPQNGKIISVNHITSELLDYYTFDDFKPSQEDIELYSEKYKQDAIQKAEDDFNNAPDKLMKAVHDGIANSHHKDWGEFFLTSESEIKSKYQSIGFSDISASDIYFVIDSYGKPMDDNTPVEEIYKDAHPFYFYKYTAPNGMKWTIHECAGKFFAQQGHNNNILSTRVIISDKDRITWYDRELNQFIYGRPEGYLLLKMDEFSKKYLDRITWEDINKFELD